MRLWARDLDEIISEAILQLWDSVETGKPAAWGSENQEVFLIPMFSEGFISLSGLHHDLRPCSRTF
jgi:hypothetical protein